MIQYVPRDLITLSEACSVAGRSVDTIRRWAREGRLTAYKKTGIRERFYSRAEVVAAAVERGAISAPSTAARFDVVPLSVGGSMISGLRGGEVELISTALLEEILEYRPGSLSRAIRDHWASEFEEGRHFVTVYPNEIRKNAGVETGSAYTRSTGIHALTEEGVGLALLKTDSEIGRRLRRALAASNFMRSAARAIAGGCEIVTTQAPQGPHSPPAWLAPMVEALTAQTAGIVALLRRQEERVERLERAILQISTAESVERPPGWHDCTLSAEEVAEALSMSIPVFRGNPRLVHRLTGQTGLRGDSGREAVPGFSDCRRDSTGYPRWYYSPACLRTLQDTARDYGLIQITPRGDL